MSGLVPNRTPPLAAKKAGNPDGPPSPVPLRLDEIGPEWITVAHRVPVDTLTDGWAWRLSHAERSGLMRDAAAGLFLSVHRRTTDGGWEIVARRTRFGIARKGWQDAATARAARGAG